MVVYLVFLWFFLSLDCFCALVSLLVFATATFTHTFVVVVFVATLNYGTSNRHWFL